MGTKLLITGANGFVGSALCRNLLARGIAHIGAVRAGGGANRLAVGDISAGTDWSDALADVEVVVHLAARVHMMEEHVDDPLAAYRAMNVDATMNLARQCALHGVRRFVFVSSIKVNGEATHGAAFNAADPGAPCDPYGVSKWEAEQALTAYAQASGMALVIVRPPLVYGPGVGANFLRLMHLVARGLPLPLGGVRNARSMVAVANLVDLLLLCTHHENAPGKVFLVSDGEDLSTAELIRHLARAMGRRSWLLPVPASVLSLVARLLGRAALADRLIGSLQLNITPTQRALSWQPCMSVAAAIDETVGHFLKHGK